MCHIELACFYMTSMGLHAFVYIVNRFTMSCTFYVSEIKVKQTNKQTCTRACAHTHTHTLTHTNMHNHPSIYASTYIRTLKV